ncbi:MAG: hypothetical protein Q7R78_00830 [bacterium]|nr:hypothetical protein [bacterium]
MDYFGKIDTISKGFQILTYYYLDVKLFVVKIEITPTKRKSMETKDLIKYGKYALVVLGGCIITESLKQAFKVSVGEIPFWREYLGIWLGPALMGWCIGSMMENDRRS